LTKPLVIVESPTKVRTLKKYLGNNFKVEATVGHIKDLPKNEMGIDIENDFTPKYKTIPGKKKVITKLKKAAGNSDLILLAPDPDREGEAIAWHTAQVLKKKGRSFQRVLFHELTKNAIKQAMDSPLELDKPKYEAQQIRRILDRLVGYEVSPLLWRKVKGGLSAGRVQSVALRIICEREREIYAFESEEYWSIKARLEKNGPPIFLSKLAKKNKKKTHIPDKEGADAILTELEGESYIVDDVKKKSVKKNPLPPFTTSKLQQEAIRKLRFSAKKTMMVAQQLYEGIDLGPGEPVGLITYMRTDSTRISKDAAYEALSYIEKKYGPDYRPERPRFFKNKKKVQDAHEAIRPTTIFQTPGLVEAHLSKDQLKLYRLIWQRFVASQMMPAVMHKTTLHIKAGAYLFTTTGSIMLFDGFTALYTSSDDQNKKTEENLPNLEKNDLLQCLELLPKQHFTQPPPRFSEAGLVKELEENGIGRPSTYAAILSTIRGKNYVELLKGYFQPTELGFIVNDLLTASFDDVFNVDFTARMEDNLDQVEASSADPLKILEDFYNSFKNDLDAAGENMVSIKGVGVPTGLTCPQCAKDLHIKIGRNGPFLACTGYPDCKFTSNYTRSEKGLVVMEKPPETVETDEVCDKCNKPMLVKQGRYGAFLGCSGYPECKNTMQMEGAESTRDTGVSCPKENCQGQLEERRSRRGKIFYGCNKYPECDFATWDKPVPLSCPDCESTYLLEKTTKKAGTWYKCPTKGCKYKKKTS